MASGPKRLTRWMLRSEQPALLDLDHKAQEDIAWAADEIERLRDENAELRAKVERLEKFADDMVTESRKWMKRPDDAMRVAEVLWDMNRRRRARKALED